MPLVTHEAMPAARSAAAKMSDALVPRSGTSSSCACGSSSTAFPARKNVAAANRNIALLIAQPMSIEKSVSKNSYLSCLRMEASSPLWSWRLWMTSECRKRLCGITTAPRTLKITRSEPCGTSGTSAPFAASAQSTCTSESS